jgi:diguanylate cyclase (GGDEF)-like protein
MSFRSRLTLFFVAIVIVPMISVAVVLFSLIADNERGKADDRLAVRQQLAVNLFRADVEEGGKLAAQIGGDPGLARALRDRDDAAATRRAESLLAELGAARIRIEDRRGERVDVGRADAMAPAVRALVDEDGRTVGRLEVSDRSAGVFARTISRLTGLQVLVRLNGETLAETIEGAPDGPLPHVGDLEVGDAAFRVASFPAPAFDDREARVSLLSAQAPVERDIARSRMLAGGVLVGFLLLAIACALLVSRSLQAQIGAFLDAARRLGRGDFTAQVPIHGRDEFAALGGEFNRMARELEGRLEDLRTERLRLENAMRRLGDAFASNLDREALLEIAAETVVDGVDADGARARLLRGESAMRGTPPTGDLARELARAEAEALATRLTREAAGEAGGVLVHPMRPVTAEDPRGVVTAWRRDRPFSEAERELFHYLAAQAAVSLDNVALHETVQRQAVTDELTGLSNHRRFQEALASEVERARRFESEVGLVMVDIDNFKQVNDLHGHQIGDLVLAQVAGVLRSLSREIDEPARYGGEELAVVLPGTDLDGAFNFGERVREGIEALEFPLDGSGGVLRVTASLGAASLPESAQEPGALIATADAALYRAKRSGKNQTRRAEREPAGPAQ